MTALDSLGPNTHGGNSVVDHPPADPLAEEDAARAPGDGGDRSFRADSTTAVVPNGPERAMSETIGPVRSGVADPGQGRGPAWLDEWMADNSDLVVAWRRELHSNPELSRAEHRTTRLLVEQLESLGLRPRRLPVGTGLICDIGQETHVARTIALRADIDALPLTESTGLPFASNTEGAAHCCGHDAHTAVLLGTAMALASAPGALPGRVRLIFQPAEEVMPGGALDVLAAGGLDGVDRIFGLHCDPRLPVGTVGTRIGALTSASDPVEVRLTSPGGHTSRPHLTADLVHALGTLITGLPTLLSRRVDPRTGTVLAWGAVRSGEAPNAIPQEGTLRGTLRTADRDTWAELGPLVQELVQGLLAPLGVGYDLQHRRGVPPVVNDAESTRLMRAAIGEALGEQAQSGTPQSSGGEDFGWYLEHVPGSFARLGVAGEGMPANDLHQPNFVLDERALFVGVRTMVHTALTALRE
ncbi:amidohydrolase [Actinopolyspora lacussalsi subsp. righensis]|uniref:Amidohydrolase n=2 Tax=Actinopolyspora righensis TaxID=995060 RepID=A0A1I6YD07_9ACTN|nr:M20 family metallopeptidase [Actinopolyspora righensis]SFT48211.1 amidohydrolase [Actinopolyspora righensis]